MEKKARIPCIFYLYVHYKIWDLIKGECISKKEFKKHLFQWKIPKELRPLIIKEMEMLGLIKKRGRYELKIVRPSFNDQSHKEYYEQFNIY